MRSDGTGCGRVLRWPICRLGDRLEGEVVTNRVSAIDALELLEDADFAKIDIEGAEWDLLLDERFAVSAPDVLVMEWHQRACPMRDAYQGAVDILRRAGYEVEGDRPPAGVDWGTIWGWKPTGGSVRGQIGTA